MLTDEVDGLLVRPKDAMALADALTSLVRDPRRGVELAAKGRQPVEEYSWPRVARRVLSYYERLLDQQQTVDASRRHAANERLAAAP